MHNYLNTTQNKEYIMLITGCYFVTRITSRILVNVGLLYSLYHIVNPEVSQTANSIQAISPAIGVCIIIDNKRSISMAQSMTFPQLHETIFLKRLHELTRSRYFRKVKP